MANLNKVMIIGNVTRDPEIKYTPKGSAVTDLGIAVNRVYTPEGGEKREETTFVDVTLWGRQAEIAGEYCKKGRSVYIEGRLQLDSWEDKTSGQKRSKLRVVGESFQLLGPRPGGGGGGNSGGGDEEYSDRPQNTQRRESSSEGGGGSGNSGGGFSSGRSTAPQAPIEEDDIPF
ncbi:MAG: single-stranded DNA-binding protein [Verrucomicrobia bacterium]|jgi:single-strand DNA-binding protein|nr:single-stranded DNA-binding protein [Verrucomicrobiota bacterium]